MQTIGLLSSFKIKIKDLYPVFLKHAREFSFRSLRSLTRREKKRIYRSDLFARNIRFYRFERQYPIACLLEIISKKPYKITEIKFDMERVIVWRLTWFKLREKRNSLMITPTINNYHFKNLVFLHSIILKSKFHYLIVQ